MEGFKRFCRKCRYYVQHDEFFGYCIKYDAQCRHNDTCEVVLSEMM